MFKILDGRELFYQWDTDCKLVIDDASIVEVHFCNRTGDCALACQTYTENGLTIVNVPNALLQQSYKLHIYAYNGAQTRFDKCYEVRARSKPTDYAYTETEVLTWHNINNRVNTTIKEIEAAERARQTDEYVRKTQELSRKNAETKRQSNENLRVSAEAARVEAEQQRTSNYNELSQLITDLSSEATAAINDTKSATNRANEAAQSAYSNGSYANQAATYAEYYGGQAEEYSHEASRAADRANAAAEQASQNADTAYYAANSANMAAESANTAADRANNAANNINDTFANALKGSARGEAVSLNDISPVVHTIEAKVKSKNLAPFPYNTQSGYNSYGITFTVNEDRSITAVGTATSFSGFVITKNQILKEGKSYIFSNNLLISYKNENGEMKYYQGTASYKPFAWGKGWVLTQIYYQVSPDKTVNETYYPFIVEATDTPEYTPYIADISAVKVKKNGKNFSMINEQELTGINIKTVIYKGYINTPLILSWNQDCASTNGASMFGVKDANSSEWLQYIGDNKTSGAHSVVINPTNKEAEIQILNWAHCIGNITNIQLEAGTVATEYEPYIEATEYEVNEDGTIDSLDSIYPTTILIPDTQGAIIDCNYNRDINKAFAELYNAIISTGGNI